MNKYSKKSSRSLRSANASSTSSAGDRLKKLIKESDKCTPQHQQGNGSASRNNSSQVSSDLSSQSVHKLMMNPYAVSVGVHLLNGLSTKTMTTEEVNRKIGLGKSRNLRSTPTTATTDETQDVKKKLFPIFEKRVKKDNKSRIDWDKTETTDDLEKTEEQKASEEEGVTVLRELIKRSTVSFGRSFNDSDLDASSHDDEFSSTVIPDIHKKREMVEKNTKKIMKLSPDKLRKHFANIIGEVAGIYSGKIPSIRHQKFKGGRAEFKQLKELNVTYPFNHVQSGIVIDLVHEAFFAEKSRISNWSNYVTNVLVPEVFIRIYAHANKITNEMAENEMLYGEDYEGSPNKKLTEREVCDRRKLIKEYATIVASAGYEMSDIPEEAEYNSEFMEEEIVQSQSTQSESDDDDDDQICAVMC